MIRVRTLLPALISSVCLRSLLIGMAIAALAAPTALAQKKPGGGGSMPPTRFSVVELGAVNHPMRITDVTANGSITVIGGGSEAGYGSAAVAKVNLATKAVTSFLLPEPTDGLASDAASSAYDVNGAGTIVGLAVVFDGPIQNNVRINKPCRCVPQGAGYRYEQLPVLAGNFHGTVFEINDAGWMIGICGTDTTGEPAIWTPDGREVLPLEAALPVDSGWSNLGVESINNHNQIVGTGLLNGVQAGFAMDLQIDVDLESDSWVLSSTIIRLVPPPGADWLLPIKISDAGEIVGTAQFADFSGVATLQADATTQAQAISAVAADAAAYQRNSLNQIVGVTNSVATLWEPKSGGGFTSTALQTLVPTKPEWQFTYSFSINEQGYICARSRKYDKGKYTFPGVLLVPNP
jgi:hypothetical protein